MRWATLPPSGRLPLDDSLTMLDPWPVGMPTIYCHYLYPETAYGFEQSCLYPTKRTLMLVSKTWAELAVEFMYGSLVIGDFGVGRPEQITAALEDPAGFVLRKWVKRVDIFQSPFTEDYPCERLTRIGFPNLRVQNMFYTHHLEKVPFRVLLSEQPLHLVEPCGSPILDRLTSRSQAFGSLRCLTLWTVKSLPTPFYLPSNLRRLTIIVYESEYFQVQNIFSTRDSIALPNLTHLTLHYRRPIPDRFVLSMEIINHIGPQLRHLTLTTIHYIRDGAWAGVDLCTILSVCTQLTELVLPSHLDTWEVDARHYGHSTLQTLGIPIQWSTSQWDCPSSFDIFSRREAFPKLATIRFVSRERQTAVNKWLAPYSLHLRGLGIRLEDYWGRLIPLAPVLEDQNQQLLLGSMDAFPS